MIIYLVINVTVNVLLFSLRNVTSIQYFGSFTYLNYYECPQLWSQFLTFTELVEDKFYQLTSSEEKQMERALH